MGRVAKKRKIKQCDPFYKGSHSIKAAINAKYDLPPQAISKRKKKKMSRMLDEKRIEREVLGLDLPKVTYMKPEFESRRPEESYKQFCRRLSAQTKQVLITETKKANKSTEKRKQYFEKRKLKAKRKKMSEQELYEHDMEAKKMQFAGAERIKFGDRYDAPPILPKLKMK